MPQPSVDSGDDDLSLRHLPDVSDLDFSFQIPGAVRGDNLLADDDLDFFKGADISIAPLASPPPTEPPGQLTHKLKAEKLPASKDGRKLASSPTLSYGNSEDHDTDPKQKKANPHELGKGTTSVNVLSRPKPKVITSNAAKLSSCEGSPAAVRLDNLRAELNLFGDNLLVGPSTSTNHQELSVAFHHHKPKGILKKSLEKKQQRISPRNNQKVTKGGITKIRCPTKLSSITSSHLDTLPIQQEKNPMMADSTRVLSQQAKQVKEDLSFTDSSMSSAAEGVAGRLVMYSQKLINSFGMFNSDKSLDANNDCQVLVSQDQEGTDMDAVQGVPCDADRPLTLSQLSPQKVACEPTPTPRDTAPMSPLRLPTKRPVSVGSNVLHKHKKSKTNASSADVSVPKSNTKPKARLPATKRHPKPNSSHSNSELRLNDGSTTKRKPTLTRTDGPARIKRSPVFKSKPYELDGGGGNENKESMGTSASSCTIASTSSLENSKGKDAEPVNSITSSNKGKSTASSSQGSARAAYTIQAATKPVPFNFRSVKRCPEMKDGGIDGRERSESQNEKRLHYSTTIPDFKAMHAAQEAELALRKENIRPIVPLPIRWETDYRLTERQKFDERMREKEREQERLMEMRRREQEEQEEREVRELRKKTVPKAHEVPEWYKEAPRKKKDNAMAGASIPSVNE